MTYQEAAKEALAVQDACNASGVIHTFSVAVSALWDEANRRGKGTDWVNRHPVVLLFLDKLAQLADVGLEGVGIRTYGMVDDIAKGKEGAY